MSDLIYGVDKTKKIAPVQVRDAVIKCFILAHKEILDAPKEFVDMSDKEFEEVKFRDAKERVLSLIKDNKGDPENPTKEDLVYVVKKLREFAKNFRDPKVIEKHVKEIMELINLL